MGVIFLIAAFFLVDFLIIKKRRASSSPKKKNRPSISKNEYLAALGGPDNVLSHALKGSRIVLSLKNQSLLDKQKIEELGVSGFIEKSNQITLVVKDDAEKVYETIFGA